MRGVPTAAATEPLKSRLLPDGEPPTVWPYAEGKVRGISIAPPYKAAPKAALLGAEFYRVLALSDAIRSGRTRERNLAIELLEKEIHRRSGASQPHSSPATTMVQHCYSPPVHFALAIQLRGRLLCNEWIDSVGQLIGPVNPRAPRGARRARRPPRRLPGRVSIHAPRVGRDELGMPTISP